MEKCTNCGRPRLLDLFCGQGGASKGYHQAGFCVLGVDNARMPLYPWDFVQGDALAYLKECDLTQFALIHASPPCQGYSLAQSVGYSDHPRLIPETRKVLKETGLPFVIENVEGARHYLERPALLCGQDFPPLRTYRHRYFETSFPFTPPQHTTHQHNVVQMGRPIKEGDWYHAVGNFSGVNYVRSNMGLPWMNRKGISESIPPAYTRFIGAAALEFLQAESH